MAGKILFVCLGNLVRSQMAEAYYNHLKRSGKKAKSAGILSYTAERHKAPSRNAIKVMKEEGIDISDNDVTALSLDLIEESDKIYVLCSENDCPYYLRNSEKDIEYWDIDDPIGKSPDDYRGTRDEIKEKVLNILRKK